MLRLTLSAAAASVFIGLAPGGAHAAPGFQTAERLVFDASGAGLEKLKERSSRFDGTGDKGEVSPMPRSGLVAPPLSADLSAGSERPAARSRVSRVPFPQTRRGRSGLARSWRGAKGTLGFGMIAGAVLLGVRFAAAMTLPGALGLMALAVVGTLMLAREAPLHFDLPPPRP